MEVNERGKNELLVEFNFLVDLDMALFRYIQNNYSNSKYVDQRIINMKNEYRILEMLLSRKHINPLEIIMPKVETTDLYNHLHSAHEEELLKYYMFHDTYYLMGTYLLNATATNITVLCKNKLEADFIKEHNKYLHTIVSSRFDINLDFYTAIYMKYFAYAVEYKNLKGKHIYIAAAKYNMDENQNCINGALSILFGDVNTIKLIDLYTKVKYNYYKENML